MLSPPGSMRPNQRSASSEALASAAKASTTSTTRGKLVSGNRHAFSHLDQRNSMYLNHLRMRRQSLTYRGAMLSIPRYKLRASSCPDIYKNSMTTIASMSEEDENECMPSSWSVLDCVRRWHTFMNPAYLIFALSNFILYAWYDVMYVYLYNYAEKDLCKHLVFRKKS